MLQMTVAANAWVDGNGDLYGSYWHCSKVEYIKVIVFCRNMTTIMQFMDTKLFQNHNR